MIFIALGTQKFQLNRLLREMDRLIETGAIREPVFAQTGHSDYVPRHYSREPFLTKAAFDENVAACDLLITHSGVGTIVTGLKLGKPVLVYPRLCNYQEHVDDHQLQIAEAFQQHNYILVCREQDSLEQRIRECRSHCFAPYRSHRACALETVRAFLAQEK